MFDYLELLLPLIIKAVQEILDVVVDGKTLTANQILALKTGYCELSIWGKKLAADTSVTYDDEAVKAILESIADMLTEAEVPIPQL